MRWNTPFRVLVGLLLVVASLELRADELPPPKRAELEADARRLDDEARRLAQSGKPAEALERMQQRLAIQERLYPKAEFPSGHIELANTLNGLGFLNRALGRVDRAAEWYERSLAILRRLNPPDKYPAGLRELDLGFNNAASTLFEAGLYDRAAERFEQGLEIRRRLYPREKHPDGHAAVASSLNNLALCLQTMGEPARALPHYEETVAIHRKVFGPPRYANGHPALATSLNNLGTVHYQLNQFDKALPLLEQSLEMNQAVYPKAKYPDGHEDLSRILSNFGSLLIDLGRPVDALRHLERAVAMDRALYPKEKFADGHPQLASSVNSLATAYQRTGRLDRALVLYEEALAIMRALTPRDRFPNGSFELATSLVTAATIHHELGKSKEAIALFEEALTMRRALFAKDRYPHGHPDLVQVLNNFASTLRDLGRFEQSFPYAAEALAINSSVQLQRMQTASEAEALGAIPHQPLIRDSYLSNAIKLNRDAAESYRAIWTGRSLITRVLELRHAAARSVDPRHAALFDQLRETRRRIDRLLQNAIETPGRASPELVALTDERDRLERELARAVPLLERWNRSYARGPEDLSRLLPSRSAFVDLISYVRFDADTSRTGTAAEIRVASYLAFISAPGKAIRRVDLGPAAPIDAAVAAWRTAIETGGSPRPPDDLSRKLWRPIAEHLPGDTETLFLAADGALARIPWAALPEPGPDRVLLDQFPGGLAVVPHGPFLMDQLTHAPTALPESPVLTVGEVAYGAERWQPLPGTRTELRSIRSPAGNREVVELTTSRAGVDQVRAALARVGYAHFATHGYFDEAALVREQQRERDAQQRWQFNPLGTERRVVARNPLAFTGLVLAGGEVLTGAGILDLPLESLRLATLSACETGLGEFTAGEGVFGLVRAFHLAGCSNVVASLWKVNDPATAALMAKFYHELWVNKKPPLAALREAQLTIYRHPELIPDLAGERGAPKLKDAVAARSDGRATPQAARSDTRLWAAFVLSGAGR